MPRSSTKKEQPNPIKEKLKKKEESESETESSYDEDDSDEEAHIVMVPRKKMGRPLKPKPVEPERHESIEKMPPKEVEILMANVIKLNDTLAKFRPKARRPRGTTKKINEKVENAVKAVVENKIKEGQKKVAKDEAVDKLKEVILAPFS